MEKKYQAKYHEDKVTAAQYLTELALERMAAKERKNLYKGFWREPKWKKLYKQQIIAANALLKVFDEAAVIQAFKKLSWAYSLRVKKLRSECAKQQAKLNRSRELLPDETFEETKHNKRKRFGSNRGLRELD